jgi:hypothetical protein
MPTNGVQTRKVAINSLIRQLSVSGPENTEAPPWSVAGCQSIASTKNLAPVRLTLVRDALESIDQSAWILCAMMNSEQRAERDAAPLTHKLRSNLPGWRSEEADRAIR